MDDLYDEDFEDLISDVPQREQGEIAGVKSEISDAQESNRYDDDFYSAAPSSAIEQLGPEATVGSNQYDDDFLSANPSAVLDQRSTVTAEEPVTPVQTVQRLSNSFLINNAIDASAKVLTDSVAAAGLNGVSAPVNNSDSWDEAEAAADAEQIPSVEPLREASQIEVNNTEESVFYEDDFAASVDDIQPESALVGEQSVDLPVPAPSEEAGTQEEPATVMPSNDVVAAIRDEDREAMPMISHSEPSSHSLHSVHSLPAQPEAGMEYEALEEAQPSAQVGDVVAPLILDAMEGTNKIVDLVEEEYLPEEPQDSNKEPTVVEISAQEFTQEPPVADTQASSAPQQEPSTVDTDNIELYNEDFDVSTSEKAAFTKREISALDIEKPETVTATTSEPEEHNLQYAALPVPQEPKNSTEDAAAPRASPSSPPAATPRADNAITDEGNNDTKERHTKDSNNVDTATASTIDDLVLTETNESAASIVSAGYVGDIMSTASKKAFTALSPAKQRATLPSDAAQMEDGDGFGEGYGSHDDFETFEDSPILKNKSPSQPLLVQMTESEDNTETQETSEQPAVFSPVENFIAATFLQAQANVSRPQSAVSRDPALTSATLSDKMCVRPVSAKLAESFVERSVSQARVNVVLGSPTKSPKRGGAAFEEPAAVSVPSAEPGPMCEPVSEPVVEPVVEQEVVAAQAGELGHASTPPLTEEATQAVPMVESTDSQPSVIGIGEAGMNERLGSSSLVLEDFHNKSTKSVAYDDFLGTLGLATPSADSKKAAQLRAMVSETREGQEEAAAVPKKKLTKREQQEADRTFLTSLQYHPPVQQTKKIVNSSSGPNLRPSSSKPAVPRGPVTKRDLLRARSAGPTRPVVQEPQAPPPKAAVPKRPSPNRFRPPADHRTKFVAAPLCLPSQMLPKDLLNYLFASDQESELHIARFCQHGRHFDTCKVELCLDAYEKYRWLNLTHQKAKDACELVSDADRMWREKLERALEEEIEEKKVAMEEELSELSVKIMKKHNASVKLLKQGVRYYESILPALHKGKVTPQELHKATGWTEEHYENFRRRLQLEEDQAHFKRKMKLDQQAHKNLEVIEQLRASLISPMMYLDGMLKHRLEKIHSAVKRIDLCFQYSIKLAIGNGKGKSEEEIKAEIEARSPMRNAIVAERMQRNTKHGFEILKASLASIADVCSEVRVMYQGIKRDHDLKKDKLHQEAASGVPRSRSVSPARRSPSPNARTKRKKRPKSAPVNDSPTRRPSSRPKSRGRSATTHTERSAAAAQSKPMKQESLERASKMSYGEDFESASALGEHDDIAEESIEIKDDTYDEQISDMMRDMMGSVAEDDYSRRPSKASKASRDRARSGSGSIAEESINDSASAQRPGGSKKNGGVRAFPSLTMSVGSGIEDFEADLMQGGAVSEKGAVMARAKALALSRSPGGRNYAPDEEDEDEITSEVDDDIGFSRDNNDNHLNKVSVSNMYDDDFEGGGGSELLRGAFSDGNRNKNTSAKKGASRKKKSTSQKVAHLISADPLVKPLANMKHSQMNDQSILHGILLSHNIPIHYTDEPEQTAVQKLKPLVITNNFNQPVVLSLSSPSKQFTSTATRPKSAEPLRTSPLLNPRASLIMASLRLPEKLVRGQIRCYHCGELFSASKTKHIPTTAVSSDTTVFERAKVRQKETGKLFPTYDKLQVTSNSEVQKQWILEQQEKQQTLVTTPKAGDHKKASTTLQRFEHPFCSWECVKAWIYANYPPHQRYQYDILIDATAGFTVQAKVC